MSADLPPTPAADTRPPPSSAPGGGGNALALMVLLLIAIAALAASLLLWQRLSSIQEQLARQSADSGTQAVEARTIAREAQDLARDSAARLTVAEARIGEVALQRSQLEELMQSLSRSRDENLVVDIDAAIRLAQQQTELTGSLQPLVAALKSAEQRIDRTAQPRLAPVQRAIAQDLERLAHASVTDTAGLLGRLDDLVRQIDELPLVSAHALQPPSAPPAMPAAAPASAGQAPWQAALARLWQGAGEQARALVRVTRIDQPEVMLLTPDQAFFLRENLKLKLLNARLAVLARRMDSARADLLAANGALNKYFDPASRRTQAASAALSQLQAHMRNSELPPLEDTFAALATAAAGR